MQSGAGVSPDLPQGGGGELTPQLPPPRPPGPPGSPDPSELGSPRSAPTFDLLSMVVSYKRMTLFLEPITDGLELARFLLGWKMPLCSMLVWLLLNILFLTLNEVGWFSVCVLCVSAPATLGYLQERCGGGASEEELSRRRSHAVHRRDLQTVHLSRQDAILEVKDLLKQLDDMLSQACHAAEAVYKVLYWDNQTQSSRFYGAVLAALCLLYSVPLGWVLTCLNSTLFLLNTDFLRVVCELREGFQPGPDGSAEEGRGTEAGGLHRTPTPTSLEDLSPGSVEEAEEAEPDDEFKDAIEEPPVILQEDDDVPMGTPDYDTISDNGLLSRNEPIRSKVSKLTEKLRKRYPTTATGSCSSCTAVFSVLKKRRSCSNCGNSFCSRCCSYKVLKSSMGATAPEAQRETVFVCAACNSLLSKLV